jgi:hypothetical protein
VAGSDVGGASGDGQRRGGVFGIRGALPRRGDREGRGGRDRYRNRRHREPEGAQGLERKVAGLGHPQHSGGDPRADRLLAIADDLGISGKYIETLRILGQHAPGIIGRPLPINVSGAIPACILDAGWPLEAIKAVPLLARAAGLSAHLYEESLRSIGFIMSHKADEAIAYDGKASSKPSHAAE